jgi:hypothetical protein
MLTRSHILPKLKPFENKRDILVHDQDVSDIMTGILANHNRYKSEYDKICISFLGFNQRQTLENIWNFVKHNVRYRVEPESTQYLKSPGAIFAPGTTSDCKNMALACAGIIDALNRHGANFNWAYRFASYRLFDKVPGHVFVVVNPDTSNEVWIDPVLPTFDNKKSYFYKIDKKPIDMSLISLAGMDAVGAKKKKEQKKADKQAKKQAKQATKKSKGEKKEERKKFFTKLKNNVKKAGKIVIKYNPATAASRNAFLLLVKLNVRSLATNLKKSLAKPTAKNELFKLWNAIGGSTDVLVKNIEEGAKKKRIGAVFTTRGRVLRTMPQTGQQTAALVKTINPTVVRAVRQQLPPSSLPGSSIYNISSSGDRYSNYEDEIIEEMPDTFIDDNDSIGAVDPVTQAAAALAAASPILIKIADFFKKHKDVVSDVADIVGINKDAEDAVRADASNVTDAIEKEAEGVETAQGEQIVNNAEEKQTAIKDKADRFKTNIPVMPFALIGGGLLALTLLKKRK